MLQIVPLSVISSNVRIPTMAMIIFLSHELHSYVKCMLMAVLIHSLLVLKVGCLLMSRTKTILMHSSNSHAQFKSGLKSCLFALLLTVHTSENFALASLYK